MWKVVERHGAWPFGMTSQTSWKSNANEGFDAEKDLVKPGLDTIRTNFETDKGQDDDEISGHVVGMQDTMPGGKKLLLFLLFLFLLLLLFLFVFVFV